MPMINDSYNKIGAPVAPPVRISEDFENYTRLEDESSYKAPYGAVVDWLKLNKLNITPEEFRKNSQYQEAYKNWANRLQSNRNLENKKQQMYYSE